VVIQAFLPVLVVWALSGFGKKSAAFVGGMKFTSPEFFAGVEWRRDQSEAMELRAAEWRKAGIAESELELRQSRNRQECLYHAIALARGLERSP
jgi:hypothetical protein